MLKNNLEKFIVLINVHFASIYSKINIIFKLKVAYKAGYLDWYNLQNLITELIINLTLRTDLSFLLDVPMTSYGHSQLLLLFIIIINR